MTDRRTWLRERTTSTEHGDLAEALRRKADHSVSLVLPARDEAGTVGALVAGLHEALCERTTLVDEIVVVDDDSVDDTAEQAERAGARVVTHQLVRRDVAPAGKGAAMWRGLAATTGDLVLFLDADVPDFPAEWVASLLLPLLREPEVELVKATYDRPLTVDGVAHPGSGGRVTRLVATPLLNVVAPELAAFGQPLAGETAARRRLLESLPFMTGYGVELQLLLAAHAAVGLRGLAQVDLGVRAHRHQSDEALGAMAAALVHVASRWACPTGGVVSDYARVVRGPGGRLELHEQSMHLELLPPLSGGI